MRITKSQLRMIEVYVAEHDVRSFIRPATGQVQTLSWNVTTLILAAHHGRFHSAARITGDGSLDGDLKWNV